MSDNQTTSATSPPKEDAEKAKEKGSSPAKGTQDDLTAAAQHMASGKRHMLVRDYNAAVESFAQGVELMGRVYGETAAECSEAYFYYGKGLLEVARLERGVIEGGEEDEDEADESADSVDGEQEEEKEREDQAAGEDDKKEGDHMKGKEGDEKTEEEEAEPKEDGNESIASNDEGPSQDKDAKDKDETEQEEEEDPSSLQLAWEILELAKICFQKQSDALDAQDPKRLNVELRLAETYQMLGEASIENENYQQAVDDLMSCLRRRQELLPEDSRSIAETHYQLGVANGFHLQFDQAVRDLEDAIAVLGKRIDNLKEGKNEAEVAAAKEKDPFYEPSKEVKELEELIPEIREKIADTRDMQNETVKKLGDRATMDEANGQVEEGEEKVAKSKESTGKGGKGKKSSNGAASNGAASNGHPSNGNGDSSAGKPGSNVNDITHMIKKRKKSDSASEGERLKSC